MDSQIDLKNESNRLATFIGWPVSFIITPKSLAAAGFYYTNHTDKVKCAFCNICVCRWEFGDNAVDEHKRHNPNCSFISSQNCGNIPLIEGIQLRGEYVEHRREAGEPIDIRGLGVKTHRVAFHLKYNSYNSRLKTFRGWTNESQKPEELSVAGFFFTGCNDEVRCYYCDGGLQNWEASDNPWVEHAKWFPNCDFLTLVKGERFLDAHLVERFKALLSRPRSDDTSSSQEGQVVSIHQTDGFFQNLTSTVSRHNGTTEQQISELMLLPPAINALELGLQPSQIRQAIRNNLQDIGRPFRSTDNFIQQILSQGQSSFPAEGDSMAIIDILRREGPRMRAQYFPHEYSSSDSSDDEDSIVDTHLNFEDINIIIMGNTHLENTNLDNVFASESQNQNVTNSQNENVTNSQNENVTNRQNENVTTSSQNENETNHTTEMDVSVSVQSNESNNINVEEEANAQTVNPENIKLSQSELEEENRRLKEARLCKICLDQELGVVMLPCAHLVACITCASSLPDCPLCRQTIKATVRTYLS
ncbi:BIR repeat,Zinc finger, RING/FYVE/PHD-type,Zinc finger, RING-type [Cinara cedri]|uniref:BIR repeat,Zinc finger, RING/FYVE/PHD-type,Zinc finger, RING-type n=1 Tax=Cinara cedri TaxID=506608 RepID=A0A5E4LXE3_9HEMI|nr:BIR repeat,Zinc finger, RING/FYVE/PHD-type,Zinc finger, RING-type [Cinara cedri]